MIKKTLCKIAGHKLEKTEPDGLTYNLKCSRCGYSEKRFLAGSNFRQVEKVLSDDFFRKLWQGASDGIPKS